MPGATKLTQKERNDLQDLVTWLNAGTIGRDSREKIDLPYRISAGFALRCVAVIHKLASVV